MRVGHHEVLEEHWNELRGAIKQRWPDIDDVEFDLIRGQPDMLVGALQEHYWITIEEAQEQIAEFEDEVLSGEQTMLPAHA
ncbi:MAG: CsbD family protein [Limisphaerales bacterium]